MKKPNTWSLAPVVAVWICLAPMGTLSASDWQDYSEARNQHSEGPSDDHGDEHHGDSDTGDHEGEHTTEHGSHDEHHSFHKNHFAVFFGSTQSAEHHGERDDPGFTLGIDYERRINKRLGIGFLVDFVVEDHREGLIGASLFLHFAKAGKLQIAPGWHKPEGGDASAVLRTGLMWDFEVGKATLSPSLLYDFSEHENLWVLGFAIGKGW